MEHRRNANIWCLVSLILLSYYHHSVQARDAPFLIFANRDISSQGVVTTDLNGDNQQTVIDDMTASGLDYDFRDKMLFWSDIETETICRSAINGSSREVLVNDTSDPENIGWDWINRKLYWTDVTRGTLEVMDVETGYRKVLISVGQRAQIRGLQLDPIKRWMYWTTIAPGNGKIYKTSMDGAQRVTLHDSDTVEFPNGITLDQTDQTLYWVDAGSSDRNIVGKSRTALSSPNMTVFRFNTRQLPFHATFFNGGLYYTEWFGTSVSRLSLDSTPSVEQVVDVDGRVGMIRVFDASNQQSIGNPCDGAQCTQLCLLSAVDLRGYSCACTEGVELNADGFSCGSVTPETTTSAPTTTVDLATMPPSATVRPGLCARGTIRCENEGICEDTNPSRFVCRCMNGYSGTFCEIAPDQTQPPSPIGASQDNFDIVLILVLGILGIVAFLAFVTLGLVLFVYCAMKGRSKNKKGHSRSSVDGLSTSSRDSPPHFVLVNSRMSEHDYMSIKSRGNSPAPSRILICNVGDQGTVPNNYIYEHPQLVRPLPSNKTQTLDYAFSAKRDPPPPPEPIYNTVKSTKTQTL